jgi:hypothetical protein
MEGNMKIILSTAALALVLPFATAAHANDVTYCKALAAKYEATLVKTAGHNPSPGTVEGNVAAYQCNQGNTAGIPVLERKLRNGKIELPARG